ncbi:MAG: hypothetical protein U0529_09600 [Thermoanaerobaculia bacterium]
MTALEKEIHESIAACQKAEAVKSASGYLPDVIDHLETMADLVKKGGEPPRKAERRVGAFFRILSEDPSLLESPLGAKLVKVMTSYEKWAARPAKAARVSSMSVLSAPLTRLSEAYAFRSAPTGRYVATSKAARKAATRARGGPKARTGAK